MGHAVANRQGRAIRRGASAPRALPVTTLRELLSVTTDELEKLDIALVNMLCAEGLPGAEDLNIPQCLATLDEWTAAVRRYTNDHRNYFYANPAEFDGHKGLFRFLYMASLLKHPRGMGIAYQPTAIGNRIFLDSRDDLLHGLLTRKLGTCTSLPTLCVAIGRRLGYPMHLATAKYHVLCQWVDDRGRLNLEIACKGGGDTAPDSHFHEWQKMTPAEIASGKYLRPLTRREELALFLETRGHCLTDNRRFIEAREAYEQAHRMAPHWSELHNHLASLSLHEGMRRVLGVSGTDWTGQPSFPTVNAAIPNRNLFPTIVYLPGVQFKRGPI